MMLAFIQGWRLAALPATTRSEATLAKIARGEIHKVSLDDEIIGGITVIDQGAGHFHLDVLAIDPAHHNKGFGTHAMGFIERTFPASLLTLGHTDVCDSQSALLREAWVCKGR